MRSQPKTVFLGGGRITSALVAGLRLANYRAPIIVHDRNRSKMERLKRTYGVRAEADLAQALADAEFVIFAVRPENMHELLSAGGFRTRVVGVSLAAGVPLRKLQRLSAGTNIQWVRAMPSPLCRVGKGLTALAFSRDFSLSGRKHVKRFFGLLGDVLEVAESKYDAFTVTYSASHGYHALETLASAAVALGLDRKIALQAAAHALGDAICCWREGADSLAELRKEAATPGGIAATVVQAMDDKGYQRTMTLALRAGVLRARRNAQS